MKKTLSLLTLSIFALGMMIASCTGPEGPQGPAGPKGADGTDGTDGVDANSFCINCHTMANKTTINEQFAMSAHGPMNGSVAYAGGRSGCAKCHSYQGYMETQLTGRDTTAAAVAIPMYFQCDMCHDFHGTLEETEFPDYALRNDDPVSLMYNNHQSTVDLAGSGNVCAYCHQPRPRDGFPIQVNGTDSIAVTSSHWGTHYGTASVILAGHDAFEVPGSLPYESSPHTTMVGCSDCHMAKNADRTDVGGHTFKMVADDGYQNLTGCVSCHAGIEDFDLNGKQTEIADLIHHLDELLAERKLVDDTGHAIDYRSANGIGRKWTSNEAGAVFNLLLAHYEGSHGVHNYKYTKALLTNTIEMVEAW